MPVTHSEKDMNFFNRRNHSETVQPQKQPDQPTSRLKLVVGNNEKMYEAMGTFLLASPEFQIPRLGEVNSHLAKGDKARANGNNMEARVEYETAAKIGIYKQDKESARSCLISADEVSEKEERNHNFHETMLADMDEVMRISKAYQSPVPSIA
jgi:hypothetical protein